MQFAFFADLIDAEYVLRGTDQLVALPEVQDLFYLSGVDEAVASQDELVLIHRTDDFFVEADDFYQMSAFHIVQPAFFDSQTYLRAGGGHHQLYRIVGDGLERVFR